MCMCVRGGVWVYTQGDQSSYAQRTITNITILGDFFAVGDLGMFGINGMRSNFEAIQYMMDEDLLGYDRIAVVKDFLEASQVSMHILFSFSPLPLSLSLWLLCLSPSPLIPSLSRSFQPCCASLSPSRPQTHPSTPLHPHTHHTHTPIHAHTRTHTNTHPSICTGTHAHSLSSRLHGGNT